MPITYTKETTPYGEAIIRDNNGIISVIPIDPANADYEAYLNPVEHLTEIVTN
jgi:hypothetical protein